MDELIQAIIANDMVRIKAAIAAMQKSEQSLDVGPTHEGIRPPDDKIPLLLAASLGNVGAINALIKAEANKDFQPNDATALHLAVRGSHKLAVDALLKAGADPNSRLLLDGRTPLHLAAGRNHNPIITSLLEKGALLDTTSKNGMTPLDMAVTNGCTDAVDTLLKEGADPNVRILGKPLLHIAAWHGHADIIRTCS